MRLAYAATRRLTKASNKKELSANSHQVIAIAIAFKKSNLTAKMPRAPRKPIFSAFLGALGALGGEITFLKGYIFF